jgi:hypothetical protein
MMTNDVPVVDVLHVKELGGHRLRVAFLDGTAGERDFSYLLSKPGEMVRPLADPIFSARVFIELGALTWPNGYVLDPINLHMQMREAGALDGAAAAE